MSWLFLFLLFDLPFHQLVNLNKLSRLRLLTGGSSHFKSLSSVIVHYQFIPNFA
jgi:hypothetical protein